MSNEAAIEEGLYHRIESILEAKDYKIEGVEFGKVVPQYRVDGGRADLMVPARNEPLLIIECKRKAENGIIRDFDPMSGRVIGQALNYAVLSGASLFATTNGKVFALFLVPERGEPFRIDKHRLMIKEIGLTEEAVSEFLTLVARWKAGLEITKTPVDWAFIIRLRSFVDYLSKQLTPAVRAKIKKDNEFAKTLEDFSLRVGGSTPETYARESAYIIMNKIVLHKILERYYQDLSHLEPLRESDGSTYLKFLDKHFDEAMDVTRDFEPIFSTGIYDLLPLPDDNIVLDEINSFIEDMNTYRLEEIGSDVVGFIYERLIPDEERHRLGQFYTPPQIAELITKWAIREPTDKILDPACGSGTFPIKAYSILRNMKPLREVYVHKEILNQIFCSDINPFPAQITALNLSMRDVKHPTSDMNVLVEDFFNIKPEQEILAPFAIKQMNKRTRRKIKVPIVDAVIANPPYTRWTEISEATKKAINSVLQADIKKFQLSSGGGIRAAQNAGIYVHFVLWASHFLDDAGRLGMIISNDWLQSNYGIRFSNFLLGNFKIKAVIDFASRLFALPLIATTVILLEKKSGIKPSDVKERGENNAVFIYVDKATSVEQLLDLIERPTGKSDIVVSGIKQSELPTDERWVSAFFDTSKVERQLQNAKKIVRLTDLLEPSRGTFQWTIDTKGAGLGSDKFFYLREDDVENWNLSNYVEPVLVSQRYTPHFIFSKRDWEKLRKNGKPCFVFLCDKPISSLPKSVREYIEWGETTPLVRPPKGSRQKPKTANKSLPAIERSKRKKKYAGWYDIGGTISVPMASTYRAQYVPRFISLSSGIALDKDAYGYRPRTSLDKDHIKALLAYLNSSVVRLYVETHGRATGGGLLEVDLNAVRALPILDVRLVPQRDIEKLASLFDQLEEQSRMLGGLDNLENIKKVEPLIDTIDSLVSQITDLPSNNVKMSKRIAGLMMERRITRSAEATAESVTGEDSPRIRPPKGWRKVKDMSSAVPLDKWTT